MPDYNEYHYEKEEICFYGICYTGLLVLIVYTFYKSYIALFLLSPLVYFLLKNYFYSRNMQMYMLQYRKIAWTFQVVKTEERS